jgi:long-chain alkane monooxygenase
LLIRDQMQSINRRTILEVTEGLVPVLQRRGLVRTDDTGNTLRCNIEGMLTCGERSTVAHQ